MSKDKDQLDELGRSLGVPPRVFAGAPAGGLASTEFKKAWDEYDQQIIWSWQVSIIRPMIRNLGFAMIEDEAAQRLHKMFEVCPVCSGDIGYVVNCISCTKCRLFVFSFSGILIMPRGALTIGFVVVDDFFVGVGEYKSLRWKNKEKPRQEDRKQRAIAALEETIKLVEDKRPEPTAFLTKYNTHDFFGSTDALVFADWCDENGYPLNAAALRERNPQ